MCFFVQWERYIRCDGTPDPAVQQDMNTYISLWRDDPEVNITSVLQQCSLALQVCENITLNILIEYITITVFWLLLPTVSTDGAFFNCLNDSVTEDTKQK